MNSPKDHKSADSIKPMLHFRNPHRVPYNFEELVKSSPELEPFVKPNKYDNLSIDFANPEAVKMLNRALLIHHYDLQEWDIPTGYLCPPIPGRADYIHHVAELLGINNHDNPPKGAKIKCLDIGTGANLIYPIVGTHAYDWNFVGTEIDEQALASAQAIVAGNDRLGDKVELRHQAHPQHFFKGIIQEDESFDIVICNPPFHASAKEAQTASLRKFKNLRNNKAKKAVLNFGGKAHELWREGGERKFVIDMVKESRNYADSCLWFTSLVSKDSNVRHIKHALQDARPNKVKVIHMGQGNKKSRIVAWTFMTMKQEEVWIKSRWV